MLIALLLFKLITTPEKETALLAIPEMCAEKIITLYHSSLFGTSRCNKDILNNSRQILYTRPYALLMFLYKGLSCMPID